MPVDMGHCPTTHGLQVQAFMNQASFASSAMSSCMCVCVCVSTGNHVPVHGK